MPRASLRAARLLLLLLVAVAAASADQGGDAAGRSGRVRRRLSWSLWSRRDKVPPHGLRAVDKDEDKLRKGIKFQLFTRENPEEPELVDIYDFHESTLRHFNGARPTKVATHGWQSDGVGITQLRTAFLSTMDVNFIAVNWTDIDTLFYPWARGYVPVIGQRVAYLLDFLRTVHGVPLSSVHLIGHSLGAHISGMAGSMVQWGTVGRITGLDPAGPMFPANPEQRLDKGDATFVDVIHTCANLLGYKDSIGHVDFFPNGGVCIQPGCRLLDLTRGTCSHNRAYDFMQESILKGDSFKGYPCSGVNGEPDASDPSLAMIMGFYVSPHANGSYCLHTRSEPPFAMDDGEQAAAAAARPGDDAVPATPPPLPHRLLGAAGAAGPELASAEDDNEVERFDTDRIILRAFMQQGLGAGSAKADRPVHYYM